MYIYIYISFIRNIHIYIYTWNILKHYIYTCGWLVSRPLVLISHHCTWILLFNERLGRSSWRNRVPMNGEGQSTKPPWLWFLCYPRDAINLSKDDWGVQSPHQESIWVPLPFSEDEPGSLKFSFSGAFRGAVKLDHLWRIQGETCSKIKVRR